MNPTVERYRNILKKDPGNAAALKALEETYFLEGLWDDLVNLYEGQVERARDDAAKAELYFKIGRVQESQLHHVSEAIAFYEKACSLNHGHVAALDHLGRLWVAQGQPAKALQIYEMLEESLQEKPAERLAVLQTVFQLYAGALKSPDGAADAAVKILELDPEDDKAFNFFRTLHRGIKWQAIADAVDLWIKRTTTLRTKQRLQHLKGLLLWIYGNQPVQALNVIKPLALNLGPWQAQMAEDGAHLADLTGDKALSDELWPKVFEKKPESPQAYAHVHRALTEKKDWRLLVEAMARHAQTLNDPKARTESFQAMGDLFRDQLKNPTKAVRCYERVLQEDPDNRRLMIVLADLYEEIGAPEKAASLLKKLEGLVNDGDSEAWLALHLRYARNLHRREKNIPGALAEYQLILARQPGSDEARQSIIKIHSVRGDWPALAAFYEAQWGNLPEGDERLLLGHELALLYRQRLSDDSKAVVVLKKNLALRAEHDASADLLEQIYRDRANWGDLLHLLLQHQPRVQDKKRQHAQLCEIGFIWDEHFQNPQKAYEAYVQAFVLDPTDRKMLTALERLSHQLLRWQDYFNYVRAELALVQSSDPQRATVLFKDALAAASESHSDVERLEFLEKWVRFSPDENAAFADLEHLYEKSARWQDLAALYADTLDNIQTPALKAQRLGRLAAVTEEHLQDPQAVILYWEKARRLDPSRHEPLENLYRLYRQHGRWQDLIHVGGDLERMLKELPDLEPWRRMVEEFAGYVENETGDTQAAAQAWERLYKDADAAGLPTGRSLDALERLSEKLQDWQALAENIKRRADRTEDPQQLAVLYRRLGIVLADRLDQHETAREYFEKAFELDADDQQAASRLKDFYRARENWGDLARILERQLAEARLSTRARHAEAMNLAALYGGALDRTEAAIDLYSEVINADPDREDAMEALIALCERSGDAGTLFEALKKRLAVARRRRDLVLEEKTLEALLAAAPRMAEPDEEEVEQLAQALLQHNPSNSQALEVVTAATVRNQDWLGLEAVYLRKKELTQEASGRKSLLLRLADNARDNLNDRPKALAYWEEILEGGAAVEGADEPWLTELMEVYRAREQWERFALVAEHQAQLLDADAARRAQSLQLHQQLVKLHREQLANPEGAYWHAQKAAALFFAEAPTDIPLDITDGLLTPLQQMMTERGAWQELAELLTRSRDVAAGARKKAAISTEIAQIYAQRLNDEAAAVTHYEAAFAADPLLDDVFKTLEHRYRGTHAWKDLIHLYEQRAEPLLDLKEVARLLAKAGQIWEEQLGDRFEASLAYQKALEVAPKDFEETWFVDRLREIYSKQRNFNGLAKILILQSAQQSNPVKKAATMLDLAALQEDELGDRDEAMKSYRHVLRMVPDNRPALQALARLALETERHEEAAGSLLALIALEEREPDLNRDDLIRLRLRLGEILQGPLSRLEEAQQIYEGILRDHPDNLEALKQLHRLHTALEHWPELITVYESILRLVESSEEKVPLLLRLAEVLEEKISDPEGAATIYRRLLDLDGRHDLAQQRYAHLLAQLGRWHDYVDHQKTVLKDIDDADRGYAVIAEIAKTLDERLARADEAVPYYFQLAEGRDDLQSLRRLRDILEQSGRFDDVERVYRLLLDQPLENAERARIQASLAHRLMADREHGEESAELFEEVLRLDPAGGRAPQGSPAYEALTHLVRYYESRQDTANLKRHLPRAAEIAATIPEKIHYRMMAAAIDETAGDAVAARGLYDAVVQEGWGQPDTQTAVTSALEALCRLLPGQNDWQALVEARRQLVEIMPDSAEQRLYLSEALLEHFADSEDAAREAFGHLEEVILLSPLDLRARHLLNRSLEVLGHWQRWLDSVDAEITLQKDPAAKAALLEKRSEVWEREFQDTEKSLESLAQAVETVPHDRALRQKWIEKLIALQRYDEAAAALTGAVDTDGGTADLQDDLCGAARLYLEFIHDPQKGRELLNRSLLMNDPSAPHRRTLDQWLDLNVQEKKTVLDDPDLAGFFQLYADHFGAEADAQFYFRWATALADDPAYADVKRTALEKTVQLNPDHREANRQLGSLYAERDEWERALAAWDRYIGGDWARFDDSKVLRTYARGAEKLGQWENFTHAALRLTELKNIDSTLVLSMIRAAGKMADTEKLQKAMALIVDESDLTEKLSEAVLSTTAFVLAKLLEEQKATETELIRRYRFAADYAPAASELKGGALFRLGELFSQLKQRHQASKALEEVLAEHSRSLGHEANPLSLDLSALFADLPDSFRPAWPDVMALRLKVAQQLEGSDDRRAAEHYWDYFLAHPDDRDVTLKLSAWYELWEDHQKLANLLAIALTHEAPSTAMPSVRKADRKWRADGYRRLAAVRLRALNDQDGARKSFEEVLKFDPDDEEAHMALAVLYDQLPHRHDQAVFTHEWLLAKDPLRIESYRSLLNHYRALNKPARATAIAQILMLLGEANAEEKILGEAVDERPPPLRPGTISAQARERYLIHPVQKEYLQELFKMLGKGLEKVYKFRLEKYDLTKADLVNDEYPPAVLAIQQRARDIYRAFGGKDLRLYWDRHGQDRFLLENDKVPALIASSDFLPLLTDVEQNFLMGRLLQYAVDGFIILQKAKARSLEKTLNALMKLMDQDSTVMVSAEDPDELEKTASKLTRRMKKELQPLIARHLNPEMQLDLKVWLNAVHATANRGGLVASGSLPIAADFLSEEAGLNPLEGPEIYKKQIREGLPLRDLIVYAASSDYFTLRDMLFG